MPEALRPGLLALLALVLAACAPPPYHQRQVQAFGTLVEVSIWGAPGTLAERAFRELEADLDYMNAAWHAWRPSTLGRFNRLCASGETFTADPSTLPLIRLARGLSARSDGLFNPAIGHLVALWGFHADQPRPTTPDPGRIAELVMADPGMDDIRMDDLQVHCTNPRVKLDFGGFAKGYGVDRAVDKLRALGIEHAVVNAGGDLRAIGRKDGRPWRIGIRHPRAPGPIAALEVAGDESVFTSGDYERYFEHAGRRYHHIIDPRTGYPAAGAAAVTVIHDDATTADAAATALMVAGAGAWPPVARSLGVDAVFLVTGEGEVEMSPLMAARLELTGDPPPPVRVLPL